MNKIRIMSGVNYRKKHSEASNVKDSASDANILNAANALASLQDKVLAEVSLQERNVLIG